MIEGGERLAVLTKVHHAGVDGVSGQAMTAPFRAPQTAFNAKVTSHRNVAWAQLDLEDVKTVKNRFGVKLNDVVMALCAGVLRMYLLDRGELCGARTCSFSRIPAVSWAFRPSACRTDISGVTRLC